MTRVSQPKTRGLKSSFVVAKDAPIRQHQPISLTREEYDALRLGITVADVRRASRQGIVASDARQEGE